MDKKNFIKKLNIATKFFLFLMPLSVFSAVLAYVELSHIDGGLDVIAEALIVAFWYNISLFVAVVTLVLFLISKALSIYFHKKIQK